MKKITSYKVELVFHVPTNSANETPWVKTGLSGWEPWGDPTSVVVHNPKGNDSIVVFQAFVKYETLKGEEEGFPTL